MGVDGERGVRAHLAQVQLPYWEYLGGETVTATTSTALTIPSTASILEIATEGGACYWSVGLGFADADSPGYIPTEGREIVGPLCRHNLDSGVWVYAPDATAVHVMYFREN